MSDSNMATSFQYGRILYEHCCYVARCNLAASKISKYNLIKSRFKKQPLANSKSKMAATFKDGGHFIQTRLLLGTVQSYCVEIEQIKSF